MSKVIQVRDVPDRVHAALVEAAEAQGLSLTSYLQRELTDLADRGASIRHNLEVIRAAQENINVRIDRETILSAIHDAREER